MKHKTNHKVWAENMITFIREKGMESEFQDWCGGYPCPVSSSARETSLDAALREITAAYQLERDALYDGATRPDGTFDEPEDQRTIAEMDAILRRCKALITPAEDSE